MFIEDRGRGDACLFRSWATCLLLTRMGTAGRATSVLVALILPGTTARRRLAWRVCLPSASTSPHTQTTLGGAKHTCNSIMERDLTSSATRQRYSAKSLRGCSQTLRAAFSTSSRPSFSSGTRRLRMRCKRLSAASLQASACSLWRVDSACQI